MIAELFFKRGNVGTAGLTMEICRLPPTATILTKHGTQKCRWIASE
jgi:hypothetical protein